MIFKSGVWLLNISGIFIFAILFFFFSSLTLVEVPDLITPTQTGKFFVFSLGILACLLFSIPYLFYYRTISINRIDLVIAFLIVFISINRYFIQDSYNFSITYYEMLGLVLVYLILRHLPEELFFYLLIAVIIGGLIQCIYGQLQLLGFFQSKHNLFRITGSFFNPGPYAGFISSIFPVALGFYLYRHEIIKPSVRNYYLFLAISYLALITAIFTLLVVVATQSRASWLSLLPGSLFLLSHRWSLFNRLRSFTKTRLQRTIIWSAIGSICLVVFTLLFFLKRDSASGRLLIWKVSSQLIMKNPFCGVGSDRFQSFYMGEQGEYFKSELVPSEVNVADNVTYAFNEVLQLTVENGVIGFLLLMVLIFVVFCYSQTNLGRKVPLHLMIIAQSSLLSIGVFSLFSYPSQILPIKLNVILCLSLIACISSSVVMSVSIVSLFARLSRIVMCTFVLGGSLVVSLWLSKLYEGFKDWDEAFTIYQTGNYKDSVPAYKKAYVVFNKDGTFLTNYGKALSMSGMHRDALLVLIEAAKYQGSTIVLTAFGDSYKAIGDYKKAEQAYLAAWYMVPARLYPQYLLARLYVEMGQQSKARDAALKVLRTSAKVESMAVEQIRSEMKQIINGSKKGVKINN